MLNFSKKNLLKLSRNLRSALRIPIYQKLFPSRESSFKIDNSNVDYIKKKGWQSFSAPQNELSEFLNQYIDLTPPLIEILKQQGPYANSIYAPRRFGKTMFLQMFQDIGMRTVKSAAEFYSKRFQDGDQWTLEIFKDQEQMKKLRCYNQPLFIPLISLKYSKTYEQQEQDAFVRAAQDFLQKRKADCQQVIQARDRQTKRIITLCQRLIINQSISRKNFTSQIKVYNRRLVILCDEYDKAILPQDRDTPKISEDKETFKSNLAQNIRSYKNSNSIIIAGVMKLSQLGINSGNNHFTEFVTRGDLGPQPFGFTKEKINSNQKILDLINAAFEYREVNGQALKIDTNYLNQETKKRYFQDIKTTFASTGDLIIKSQLQLTPQNFIDVIFDIYDGYRLTVVRKFFDQGTSIPATILQKCIIEVLNAQQKYLPTNLWTQTASINHIKDVVTDKSSSTMNLFKILEHNQIVQISTDFLVATTESYNELLNKYDEEEQLRMRFTSMLYYGGYFTVKRIYQNGKKVDVGPPNNVVYSNLIEKFNNIGLFQKLNTHLYRFFNDRTKLISLDIWQQFLTGINDLHGIEVTGKNKQAQLTARISALMHSHLKEFQVYHQLEAKESRRRPDISVMRKETNEPFVIIEYMLSDNYQDGLFVSHKERKYFDDFKKMQQYITVAVDKNDMRTIFKATSQIRGKEAEIIIEKKSADSRLKN